MKFSGHSELALGKVPHGGFVWALDNYQMSTASYAMYHLFPGHNLRRPHYKHNLQLLLIERSQYRYENMHTRVLQCMFLF